MDPFKTRPYFQSKQGAPFGVTGIDTGHPRLISRLGLNTHQKNDKVGDRGAARLASALEKNEAWQRCVRG